jgi:hypothetical protein
MREEALKLELIEWLAKLNDSKTIEYLKHIKDNLAGDQDWWLSLPDEQKAGIERGLNDIENQRLYRGSDVRKKYGL